MFQNYSNSSRGQWVNRMQNIKSIRTCEGPDARIWSRCRCTYPSLDLWGPHSVTARTGVTWPWIPRPLGGGAGSPADRQCSENIAKTDELNPSPLFEAMYRLRNCRVTLQYIFKWSVKYAYDIMNNSVYRLSSKYCAIGETWVGQLSLQ